MPNLQSFFPRETWGFAVLPFQIKQKHHCGNYSDLASSRSHCRLFVCKQLWGKPKKKVFVTYHNRTWQVCNENNFFPSERLSLLRLRSWLELCLCKTELVSSVNSSIIKQTQHFSTAIRELRQGQNPERHLNHILRLWLQFVHQHRTSYR